MKGPLKKCLWLNQYQKLFITPIKLPFRGVVMFLVDNQGDALGYNELGFQPENGLSLKDTILAKCILNGQLKSCLLRNHYQKLFITPFKLPFRGVVVFLVDNQGNALGYNELGFQPENGLRFVQNAS